MRQSLKHILSRVKAVRHLTKGRRVPRARRKWRVEIINENTLIRVWSLHLPELRAWIVGAALVAGMVSLVIVLLLFTPLGQSLRGHLPGALRGRYIELAMEVDSLHRAASVQQRYTDNIMAILNGTVSDTVPAQALEGTMNPDSLLPASEAEKMFVQQFESRERFNISVLSPIAAEGMIFEAPTRDDEGSGPVAAIYRGTVVGVSYDSRGLATVTVQHPNDFISVYGSLKDVYVGKGAKVDAAQRIGVATTEQPVQFELWRAGSLLDATKYVNYPHKL